MDESFESDKWKAIQGQFVDSFLKQRTALHSLIRSAVASDTIPTTDEGLCSRMAMSAAKHFDVDAGIVRNIVRAGLWHGEESPEEFFEGARQEYECMVTETALVSGIASHRWTCSSPFQEIKL